MTTIRGFRFNFFKGSEGSEKGGSIEAGKEGWVEGSREARVMVEGRSTSRRRERRR